MKTTSSFIVSVLLMLLCLSACKKASIDSFTITQENLTVGSHSVAIEGSYSCQVVIKDLQAFVSEKETGTRVGEFPALLNGTNFSLEITGLKPGTEYTYRYSVEDGVSDPFQTEAKTFLTKSETPTVKILETTALDQMSYRVKCEVVADGGTEVTERGICWNTMGEPTLEDVVISHPEGGVGVYSLRMEDLDHDMTYYVRAYAKNAIGVGLGEVASFHTAPVVTPPQVSTVEITEVTWSTALCAGSILGEGVSSVTGCGVCWSTSHTPTTNDNHQTATLYGMGHFSVELVDLTPNTTYYVRAYATNSQGVFYGNELNFTTLDKPMPVGAVHGLFSVSDRQQVWFSQGNLQYQASTNTWRFAKEQYECVGDKNSSVSSTYTGWIDQFGWGTSGYNHGAVCYQPWSVSEDYNDYYAYGELTGHLYDDSGQADWGYNPISNGGNTTHTWRTLTVGEWDYVFNRRSTLSDLRFVKAEVDGVNGVLLFPDDWDANLVTFNGVNLSDVDFSSNVVNASHWPVLEEAGVVFLPASGGRSGTSVNGVGTHGCYWSASSALSAGSFSVNFHSNYLDTDYIYARYMGNAVRLVCDQ